MPEKYSLKGGKIYFGSQFQSSHAMVALTNHFEPEVFMPEHHGSKSMW
jgi:hypothetical protein